MTETDPQLLVGGDPSGGNDAQIVGELLYVESARCFVLESELPFAGKSGETVRNRNVVVWPPGTDPVQEGTYGVDVPGFGAVTVGDWVEAAGAYVAPGESDEELPVVAPECLSPRTGEFVIIDGVDKISPDPPPG